MSEFNLFHFSFLGHTFSVFEALMLICFGSSWPFAIRKTIKAKSVKGKSLLFLSLIFLGYIAGIAHKIYAGLDVVVALYILNGILVGTEIGLYFMYRNNDEVNSDQSEKVTKQEHTCNCGCK